MKVQNKITRQICEKFWGIKGTLKRNIWGKRGSKMKNGVFWVVTPCGSCKNRRFGGTWRLLHQGDKNR
jgi:hypothetical protein